ncbi:MAG: glycoside hydrolase family 5 protein [Oscillospiraceae bacterium]
MRNISSAELLKEWTAGWNVGNSLDACKCGGLESEESWHNPKVSQKLIDGVILTGLNVIRVPVTWSNHLDENFNIDKAWMDRVQEVVDYAYKRGVFVILNTHHENFLYTSQENYPKASEILVRIWEQICERFGGYGERLLFEGLNEPRKNGAPDEWHCTDEEAFDVVNKLNMDFVKTVRSSGGNNAIRHLVLATYCGACTDEIMRSLKVPDDDKVIVNVHSYIPWDFAAKEDGSAEFNNTAELDATFEYMKKYCADKNIPLMINEFGAVNRNNTEERVKYIEYFKSKADALGIKYLWWDNGYRHSFALFDRKNGKPLFKSIVDALVK